MTEPLTQEQIVERGIKAAELLASGVVPFIQEYKDDLMVCIGNSAPHEAKTRESLYYQHRALQDFEDRMKQYVDTAQQILKASEAPESGEAEGNEDYE